MFLQSEVCVRQPVRMKDLYDAGNYDEIIQKWTAVRNNQYEATGMTDWDFLYIMRVLYARKTYRECIECYKTAHAHISDISLLNEKLGWSLYNVYVKAFNPGRDDPETLKRQIDFIIRSCPHGQYSPRWKCVKAFTDMAMRGKLGEKYGCGIVPEYLGYLNPDELTDTAEENMTVGGKIRPGYSDRENWYNLYSKALLHLGRYDECLKCCDEGLLKTNGKSDATSWLKYRKILALKKLGRAQESEPVLNELKTGGLRHYIVYQLIFEDARDAGKADIALRNACLCALFDNSHDKRVKFYADFADYLEACGMTDKAMLHRRLAITIREESGWGAPKGSEAWEMDDEIKSLTQADVLKRLMAFWKENSNAGITPYEGVIGRISQYGKFGFIDDREGHSYFFRINDVRGDRRLVKPGCKVRFTLEDRLDRKRNEVKPTAVFVEPVSDKGV